MLVALLKVELFLAENRSEILTRSKGLYAKATKL